MEDNVKAMLKECELFSSLDDAEVDLLMTYGQIKQIHGGKYCI